MVNTQRSSQVVGGFSLFFSLFNNITIFIALITLYSYLNELTENIKSLLRSLIMGLCFGFFAVGCMYARIPVFEGVIVDQRNAIIALGAAFGGPVAGFISAALAGLFRAYLGGSGVMAGIIGVNLAAIAGSLLYFLKGSFTNFRTAALRSVMAVIIILPGFLFVGDLSTGWSLMVDMALPYGGAIFIGIILGGLLLNREEKRSDIKKALKISEEKYRILFESFPLGISTIDTEGNIIETNAIAKSLVGITEETHKGTFHTDSNLIFFDQEGEPVASELLPGIRALNEKQKIDNVILGFKRPDDKTIWLNVTATPIPLHNHGAAIVYNDISERKRFESGLKKALDEKNILIQELYHRTKNNMQMIIAILGIQGTLIKDSACNSILSATQNRIYSMALVHEKLYQSQDLLNINLSDYIRDLVSLLVYNYEIDQLKIKIDCQFEEDDIEIDIDTAIPLGLVLQELISNTFKHAFPDQMNGRIIIKLERNYDGTFNLTIADNGIGLPASFNIKENGKLGISTIVTLVEQQLNGAVHFESSGGVKCCISFSNAEHFNRLSIS